MYKLSTVTKPVEPTTIWNAMYLSLLAGNQFQLPEGQLSFMDNVAFEDPDGAVRGVANPAYLALPTLMDLDPTCVMATAKDAANRRNPAGSVGYTYHHRNMEYISAISSQFMTWWYEFCTITQIALAAEAAYKADRPRLGSTREARYGDGDIEAFLLAVGEITGGVLSYPVGKQIDVMTIFNNVLNAVGPLLGVLDDEGAKLGEFAAQRHLGIGTMPQSGNSIAFLSSATINALYRAPWKRMLTNTRARTEMRPQFESRIEAVEISGVAGDGILAIAEADDLIFLPDTADVGETLIDTIFNQADARPLLTDALYAAGRDQEWTDQLYTVGDLVTSIFVTQTVDPIATSRVCTLLGAPGVDPPAGASGARDYFPTVAGTGALGSLNFIDDTVTNYISGTTDFYLNDIGGVGWETNEGYTDIHLPNGVLYLGSCANATAINWIEILRWLDSAYSTETRLLLDRTGRAKLSLPMPNKAKIASTDALLAGMAYHGQRDGYLTPINPSFNVERKSRPENDGPALYSTASGALGTQVTSPTLGVGWNNWDRIDNSDGIHLVNYQGGTLDVPETFSRFVGQWNGGRISNWVPWNIPSALAMGSGTSPGGIIGSNLLSLPMFDAATPILPMPTGVDYAEIITGISDQTDLSDLYVPGAANADQGACQWENQHPTRGFMRGLAMITPIAEGNMVRSDDQQDRYRLNVTAGSAVAAGGTITTYSMAENPHGLSDELGDMTTSCTHFFDPASSKIVGDAWYRWAGHSFTDVLPDPYAARPFAIPTSSMTLSDINTLSDGLTERTIHAAIVTSTDPTPTLTTGLGGSVGIWQFDINNPLGTPPLFADGEGRLESDKGSGIGFFPMGAAIAAPSMLAGLVNVLRNPPGGHAQLGSYEDTAPTLALDMDTIAGALPTFEANMSVMNGCARNTVNRVSCVAYNQTNGISSGSISSPESWVGGGFNPAIELPTRYQGENNVLVGNEHTLSMVTLVDGIGLLPDTDLMSYYLFDSLAWLANVYQIGDVQLANSTLLDSVGSFVLTPFAEAYSGRIGHSSQITNDAIEALGSGMTGMSLLKVPVPGFTTVPNPWFSALNLLTNRRARARTTVLSHPWVRGESGPGCVTTRFELGEVTDHYTRVRGLLRSIGTNLSSGLDNSLFLEIQIAN